MVPEKSSRETSAVRMYQQQILIGVWVQELDQNLTILRAALSGLGKGLPPTKQP